MVCEDIVDKYKDLHRDRVKIIGIFGFFCRYGDIRSDDGYLWEVKQFNLSPISALKQLVSYLSGISAFPEETNVKHFKRGDNRIIPAYEKAEKKISDVVFDQSLSFIDLLKGAPIVFFGGAGGGAGSDPFHYISAFD